VLEVAVIGDEIGSSLAQTGEGIDEVQDGFVRNRTPTLIEREDDTRSWRNFLIYFSHSTTMSCPPRGWEYILIGC
jgi:hypothetical protein